MIFEQPPRPPSIGKIELRPYQSDAIDRLENCVARGTRRVLLVAPTGAGKCLTRDTLVWSNGLRRFGDLWGSERILGPGGPANVAGWYDDGRREGLEVTLDCGLTIDATRAHRIWVRTADGTEEWRHVDELDDQCWVAVARGRADFGDTEVPLDEAYALGILIADACCNHIRLQVDKQVPVLERIRSVIGRWHAEIGPHRTQPSISELSSRHAILIANGDYRPLLAERYGIDWNYSENRSIPRVIIEGTREVVRAFLRGYFDGDGYCSRCPGVSSASQRLSEEVVQLLLGLGVYASIRRKNTAGLPAFVVTVRDIDAFAREIGFTDYGLTKDNAFRQLLARRRNTNVDLVPGVGGLLRRAAKFVRGHTLRNDSWRHVDAYFESRLPSYAMLRGLLNSPEALPASDERDELQRIVDRHYAWSKSKSIRPSIRRRIDCEVADQHAFIGNGIVNHNTVIAGSVISRAAIEGKRVLFLAHRRELINQAYRKLLDFGLPASALGVMMASDPRRRPGAPVQVASVDTLRNRAKPTADLVFTDECHRALSRTHRDIAAAYPNAVHVGLTATPYRADGKGLGDAYDELIVVSSPRQLIDEGFLVEPRVFTVPIAKRPDLSKVKLSKGDYAADALEQAVDRTSLVGNIVEHWMEHAQGTRTVVFAVSVAHSRHIVERFCAAGIAAEHLDGMTPTPERDAILGRLDRGETLVVTSVGVLSEGWDQPSVKCAILARPTKSTGLYLQQAGRILRPWQGQRAIILDHGSCVLEHGLPQDDREFSLEGRKKRLKTTLDAPVRECPSCNAVLSINSRICPECGYQLLADRELPEEQAGKLVEVTVETLPPKPKPQSHTDYRTVVDRMREAARNGGRMSWADVDRARASPPSPQQDLFTIE